MILEKSLVEDTKCVSEALLIRCEHVHGNARCLFQL